METKLEPEFMSIHFFKKHFYLAAFTALWAGSVSQSNVSAQVEDSSPSSSAIEAIEAIDTLIETLRHSQFEVREKAAVSLLQYGTLALEPLQQIPVSWSREARERATTVLEEIEKRHLIRRSREFLVDPDVNQAHGLPSWDAFREFAGDSRNSKLLFLEMIKSQYLIAQRIESLHQRRLVSGETSTLQSDLAEQAARQSAVLNPRFYQGTNMSVGDSVAMLLVVAMLDNTAPIEINKLIHTAVQLNIFGYLDKPGYRQCLQRLLSHWIPKTQEEAAPEVMRIAFELDLPEVLPIARRHLSERFDRYTRENALMCIGKFGDLNDLSELLRLASDTTIVHEFSDSSFGFEESSGAPPGLPGNLEASSSRKVIRINDIAAAAGMVLLDQDLEGVFPLFSREQFLSKRISGLAVEQGEADSRTEAIKSWAIKQ